MPSCDALSTVPGGASCPDFAEVGIHGFGSQIRSCSPFEAGLRDRPGIECPDLPGDLSAVLLPLDQRFGLLIFSA